MRFPIFRTKIEGLNGTSAQNNFGRGRAHKVCAPKFNLLDPKEQKEYFQLKVGKEIEKLRDFFEKNTLVVYLLGKKNSGKGTYSKMFGDVILPERIDHFSIGDMVRAVDEELKNETRKEELINYLKRNYRGRLSLEEIFSSLENRNTKTLLPTELILVLFKREIEKREKKTLFIDGFPRELDQIGFSLFFRDLIGHRDDQDIFILIDVPENVIDQRIKYRVICPNCKTSRNLKLLPISKIGYDEEKKEFYLICDNQNCREMKMIRKEGDELGIEPIKERLKMDEKLIEQAFSLYGIPKIFLRNSIPVKKAKNFVDDYEITPEYVFEWNKIKKKVKINQKPWIILDDEGIESYSLLPQPVVVSLIKQMVDVLNL